MVRSAELTDYDSIVQIREDLAVDISSLGESEYRVQIQQNGFLLPLGLSIEEFEQDLSQYIVSALDGEVVGYLRLDLDEEREIEPEETVSWFNNNLKDLYFSTPHANIGGVGVQMGTKRTGLGTALLQDAEQQAYAMRIPYLFSSVVSSPITNFASILFHEKNGFERVAIYSTQVKYLGMAYFQSILYAKRLFRSLS
ncbi:MAG: GNAT family N-acetyltransferase [Candidatus Saccharimonadales bacterium]